MCKICGHSICPGACPNADEPRVFGKCINCGDTIYEGDEYYLLDNNHNEYWCEQCIEGARRTAEVGWR